jgi:hypothetical protein
MSQPTENKILRRVYDKDRGRAFSQIRIIAVLQALEEKINGLGS